MKSLALAGLALAILSACGSVRNVKTEKELRMTPTEGIVLIGTDDRRSLLIRYGKVVDGKFVSELFSNAITGIGKDGHFIRKLAVLPPDHVYALVGVYVGATPYLARCNAQLRAFTVKPGVVQYITSFDVGVGDGGSAGAPEYDGFETEARHFRDTFGDVAPEVVRGEKSFVRYGNCTAE